MLAQYYFFETFKKGIVAKKNSGTSMIPRRVQKY